MSEAQWNGRDVVFVEYDIAVGEAIMEAAVAARESSDLATKSRPAYLGLVASARYADDGKPVFASIDEVRAQPYRLILHVQRLASLASERNEIMDADNPLPVARADVPASARAGNGADSS